MANDIDLTGMRRGGEISPDVPSRGRRGGRRAASPVVGIEVLPEDVAALVKEVQSTQKELQRIVDTEMTGVVDAEVTQTSTESGGANVVTFTLGNGKTVDMTIRNGSAGATGATGAKGEKGDTGAAGATGAKGDKGDTGATGATGATGLPAGFGTPTASVDANVGTPSVTITASGANTAKVFHFAFSNLKGETGATGAQGPQGIQGIQGETGPQGPQGIQGEQGLQGNSGYTGAAGELEVVNNLTDGGATKALSAEMGKELNDTIVNEIGPEISQLDEAVNGINANISLSPSFTEGRYINVVSSGIIGQTSAGDTMSYSDYVDIGDYVGYTLEYARTCATGYTMAGICFYDESYAVVSTEQGATNQSARGYVAGSIEIPEGAKYVRFSSSSPGEINTTITEFYARAIKVTEGRFAEKTTVEALGTTVSNLGTSVSSLNTEVAALKSLDVSVNGINQSLTVNFTAGKYVRFDTGALVTYEGFSYSDYVDVSAYVGLPLLYARLARTGATIAGIAFYDSNKTYTSGEKALVNQSEAGYGEGSIIIPEGTKYVRFTGLTGEVTTDITTFYAKIYQKGLTDDVADNAGVFDISAYNASDNTPATYASLTSAIAAIPVNKQRGGLMVKYIDSSTSRYVFYRLIATSWSTTESEWVKDDPISEYNVLSPCINVTVNYLNKNGGWGIFSAACITKVFYVKDCSKVYFKSPSMSSSFAVSLFLSGLDDANDIMSDYNVYGKGSNNTQYECVDVPSGAVYLVVNNIADYEVRGLKNISGNEAAPIFEDITEQYDQMAKVTHLFIKGVATSSYSSCEGKIYPVKEGDKVRIVYGKGDRALTGKPCGFYSSVDLSEETWVSGGIDTLVLQDNKYTCDIVIDVPSGAKYLYAGEFNDGTHKHYPKIYGAIHKDSNSIFAYNPKTVILPNLMAALMRETSNVKTLSFMQFSDIHGSATSLKRMKEFYDHYHKRWVYGSIYTLIDDVLATGDLVTQAIPNGFDWWAENGGSGFLITIGNHDSYTYEEGLLTTVPEQQPYETFIAPYVENWGVVQPEGAGENDYYPCYYYKDYADAKVRLIALDSQHYCVEGDPDASQDVPAGSQAVGYEGVPGTQDAWFAARLEEARTLGYSVIVTVHFGAGTITPIGCYNTYGLTTGESVKTSALQHVQDFIDAGGEFIGWFGGHQHRDMFGTIVGFPDQISYRVENCTADYPPFAWPNGYIREPLHTIGSKKQDCFNIITINTENKLLKMFRVGNDIDNAMRLKTPFCMNYVTKVVYTP